LRNDVDLVLAQLESLLKGSGVERVESEWEPAGLCALGLCCCGAVQLIQQRWRCLGRAAIAVGFLLEMEFDDACNGTQCGACLGIGKGMCHRRSGRLKHKRVHIGKRLLVRGQ
jgi:hypothetical protein